MPINYTFEHDDRLSRKELAQLLTSIIDGYDYSYNEDDPKSIAINGQWGAGKTQFLKMWKNYLIHKNDLSLRSGKCSKYSVVYFNAWKYDYHESPLIPLAYTVYHCLDKDLKEISEENNLAETFFNTAITLLAVTQQLDESVKQACKEINLHFSKKAQNREQEHKNSIDRIIDDFKNIEQFKAEFQNSLHAMTANGRQIIILIDELDRCKPTFAIATLELVKHFFNCERVACVYALDDRQLSKAISTVYGQGMDAFGYLSRFFGIQVSLNAPNLSDFIEKYNHTILDEEFKEAVLSISKSYELSLREIKIILDSCNYIMRDLSSSTPYYYKTIILLLLTIQRKSSDDYYSLIHNGSFILKNIPTLELETRFINNDFYLSSDALKNKYKDSTESEYARLCEQLISTIKTLHLSSDISIGEILRQKVELFKTSQ